MKSAIKQSPLLIGVAVLSLLAGVSVVADTGSPPPPAFGVGIPSPATKGQIKAYEEVVLPTYLASLPNGLESDSYPMFVMFLATYPCSNLERAVYCHLYLQDRQVLADI
ncbi:MAG: hypothetical protein ACK5WX_07435 [bacterium]|jgi:hypothetical protein